MLSWYLYNSLIIDLKASLTYSVRMPKLMVNPCMFPIFIMFDSDRLSLSFVKVSKREDSRLLCEFYIEAIRLCIEHM